MKSKFLIIVCMLCSGCMLFRSNVENARNAIKNRDYKMALYHYRMEVFDMEHLGYKKDPYVYDEFGVFCDLLGKQANKKFYNDAIENYTKAIQLNDKVAGFYINRSYPYGKLGMYKEALNDNNKAIELTAGQDPIAYYNRGGSYSSLNQYQNAIADFDKVISICSSSQTKKCLEFTEKSYVNKATAYIAEKQFGEAKKALDKAKELDEQDALIYINLGVIAFMQEDCKNALANFKIAATINPVFNERADMANKHCQQQEANKSKASLR